MRSWRRCARPWSATARRPESKLREAEANRKESAKIRVELELRLDKAEVKAKRDAERIIASARETAEAAFAEIDRMRAQVNDERGPPRGQRGADKAAAEPERGRGALCPARCGHAAGKVKTPTRAGRGRATPWSS